MAKLNPGYLDPLSRRRFLRGMTGAVATLPFGVAGLSAAGQPPSVPTPGSVPMDQARRTSSRGALARAVGGLGGVGGTPLIRLHRLPDPGGAQIWVKWEGANPTGSMKDRMALGLVEEAERRGELRPGMKVVELTGGSTGSSLAMILSPRGYEMTFVTTDAVSIEKRRTMAALGATLEVMPSQGRGLTPELVDRGMERVRELASDPDTYWTNQFDNPANSIGYHELGREILEGGPVDAFVMGVGTGGCLTGVATVLDEAGVRARIVAVEPAASRNLSGGPTGGHRIEGIGIGFVPDTFQADLVDEIQAVTDEEAFQATRALAREEGLFAGPSSGANLVAAMRVASRLSPDRRVVTLLCDSGLRYLADEVFDIQGVEPDG